MPKTLTPEYLSDNITVDQKNKRLVVTGYAPEAVPSVFLRCLINIAGSAGLEKIWLWALPADVPVFLREGCRFEGSLYAGNDREHVVSLAFFLNKARSQSTDLESEDSLLRSVRAAPVNPLSPLPAEISLKLLDPSYAFQISNLLSTVFLSYPSPVDDPDYLRSLFLKGNRFAGALYRGELIAVTAAYPDPVLKRCEMTDCATLENFRGYSLTQRLLLLLEQEVQKQERYTLYTLARARSFGMNRVFYKLNYQFRGRLINNCHIGGSFEDMNLWAKY